MLEVGIIGGAGYTAGELIRLLLNHPKTNINFVYSTSNAGNKLYQVHQDLIGSTEISFTNKINTFKDDLYPSVDKNNTLYFASYGHNGKGNLDIFKSEITNEVFSKPINLSNVINSNLDDFGFNLGNQ